MTSAAASSGLTIAPSKPIPAASAVIATPEVVPTTCAPEAASAPGEPGLTAAGKFIACSNFPECKNVLKEKKDSTPPEPVGRACPKCEGVLIYRVGRFGKFIACTNFPKCKHTEKIPKTDQAAEPAAKDEKEEDGE